MITVREIGRRSDNLYFIIFEIDKKVYSFNGDAEVIINYLHKLVNDK